MADASRPHRLVIGVPDVFPPATRQMIDERFGEDFDLRFAEDAERETRMQVAAEAEILLVMWGGVDAGMMAGAPNLRLVQKLGVGIDKIDLGAARRHGITVLRAAGINAEAVADMTLLLILALSRRLMTAVDRYRRGEFAKEDLRHISMQLKGRTCGLVGLGHIGRAVARRLHSFGSVIVYHDVVRADTEVEAELGAEFVSLEELLSASDIISLHAPADPGAPPLLDAGRLDTVREGVIIVNTARGGLIDLDALHHALVSGTVAGAGLDVTAPEPLPPSSPLFDHPNVILTPHMGGAVINNMPIVLDRARGNIDAFLTGDEIPGDADVVVEPAP